ncbi:MAG: class I SAM-dependent methyltransferase [Patescibacteria group bacterium]
MPVNTSWGQSADWYDSHLKKDDTYHSTIILPNLLKAMKIKLGQRILEIGGGTGFFANEFQRLGAIVTVTDVAEELLKIGMQKYPEVNFKKCKGSQVDEKFDEDFFNLVTMILCLQNIEDFEPTLRSVARVMKGGARLYIVLNHPVLRVPRQSSWVWDEKNNTQFRRLDGYMSEVSIPMQMHPGADPEEKTWTFHRPLSAYFRAFRASGFVITRLDEWCSQKVSVGAKAKQENRMREEIPLFMSIELTKIKL